MGRRLTKRQKAANRANYNRIRREYNKIENPDVDYKTFKKMVLGRAEGTGESIKEAAKNVAHSRAFTSAEDVAKENILKGLKREFRDVYDELRWKAGRYEKGETLADKIEWSDKLQSYVMESSTGERYMIDISNSPKQAQLIRL